MPKITYTDKHAAVETHTHRGKAWIAEITGRDEKYGLKREFLSRQDITLAVGGGKSNVYRTLTTGETMPRANINGLDADLVHAVKIKAAMTRETIKNFAHNALTVWLTATGEEQIKMLRIARKRRRKE